MIKYNGSCCLSMLIIFCIDRFMPLTMTITIINTVVYKSLTLRILFSTMISTMKGT